MSKTNTQRTIEARAKILSVARNLFGKYGYVATSTPMIAKSAGMSRGALYHHFTDKAALFQAVVEAEYERLEANIDLNVSGATDPLEALIEGGEGFIRAASDPLARQILFVDGPSVVGGGMLLAVDNEKTTNSLLHGIKAAQKAGRLPTDIPASALTSMMSGAYDRAVLDGYGKDNKSRLAIHHAIRSMWYGLSKLA